MDSQRESKKRLEDALDLPLDAHFQASFQLPSIGSLVDVLDGEEPTGWR
jgi:hypothetical protein